MCVCTHAVKICNGFDNPLKVEEAYSLRLNGRLNVSLLICSIDRKNTVPSVLASTFVVAFTKNNPITLLLTDRYRNVF